MTVEQAAPFTNPIIPGFYPDPSICRVGETFVLVASSFEYFPAVPVFTSTDLVNWSPAGHALPTVNHVDLAGSGPSKGIYASTIRSHGGRIHVVGTNVDVPGQFLVSAESPRGPWTLPIWVDQQGIDPSLFIDDDGTVYLQSTVEPEPGGVHEERPSFERGIQQSVIDLATGEILDRPRFIWGGSGGRFPEAPHMYKREGWYYLMLAEGGTEAGHMITMGRARSPWGPFEPAPANPLLSHRSSAHPFQSIGHADLVELEDGSWWMVCLGTRPHRQWHHLGRETFLVPVDWSGEWPVLGVDGRVPVVADGPALVRAPSPARQAREVFDGAALDPARWVTVRTPKPETISVSSNPGRLTLVGATARLDDPDATFVGQRIRQPYTAIASGMTVADAPSGEAGLTIRSDETHRIDIGVEVRGGSPYLVARRCVGGVTDDICVASPVNSVVLTALVHPDFTRVAAIDANGETLLEQVLATRYLSSEVSGSFTGSIAGLYAVGSAVATFDWFEHDGHDEGGG
ncbi:glycoside hydrolase family 43 protein [Demequina maris]|uniref:glycoside hydrolase family 43 protein n=1 Tax=Demequina maris TaxID=1638982 RepID=UPI000784A96F|nr:glycoside hydrolase family 43 protein [Demequina maris]